MRQIKTRQLVRRCPECRKVNTGPVPIVEPAKRKPVKKRPAGRKAVGVLRAPTGARARPPERVTLLEVRAVDLQPGEAPATALHRVSSVPNEPAGPPQPTAGYRNMLAMLD